jgi:hypothetical protein
MPNKTAVVVRIPAGTQLLPDNKLYTHRFEIHSSSSDSVYVIAQSKSGRWWSCGCFGWIRHKHCKHLEALGLPGYHTPHEARLTEGK